MTDHFIKRMIAKDNIERSYYSIIAAVKENNIELLNQLITKFQDEHTKSNILNIKDKYEINCPSLEVVKILYDFWIYNNISPGHLYKTCNYFKCCTKPIKYQILNWIIDNNDKNNPINFIYQMLIFDSDNVNIDTVLFLLQKKKLTVTISDVRLSYNWNNFNRTYFIFLYLLYFYPGTYTSEHLTKYRPYTIDEYYILEFLKYFPTCKASKFKYIYINYNHHVQTTLEKYIQQYQKTRSKLLDILHISYKLPFELCKSIVDR